MPEPDARGTDGPFATLQQARDTAPVFKNTKISDISVPLREGEYFLKETVVFGLEGLSL